GAALGTGLRRLRSEAPRGPLLFRVGSAGFRLARDDLERGPAGHRSLRGPALRRRASDRRRSPGFQRVLARRGRLGGGPPAPRPVVGDDALKSAASPETVRNRRRGLVLAVVVLFGAAVIPVFLSAKGDSSLPLERIRLPAG